MLRIRKIIVSTVAIVLSIPIGLTQVNTGTISGVVHDETGAVVPGAAVTLTNTGTGASRTVQTDSQGRYQAPSLPLGDYEVRVESTGFQREVRSGIRLTVGREAQVDLTLHVGEVTQTVEVTGEAPLVDTASSSVGGLVEERVIKDLPLNGRSYTSLAQLQVGVTWGKRGGGGIIGGQTPKISVSGARPSQNTVLLDGTSISDYRGTMPGGTSGLSLGVEAVQEFQVLTHNYSAAHGRSSGGILTVVTKSGTNQFHGSVFEFLRNDNLDAANFFDNAVGDPKPEFKRNQFGASAGGPIVRNRTFFFSSYEGLRDRLGETQIGNVLTVEARQGFLPAGNVTVAEAVGPYINLFPLPNGPLSLPLDGTAQYSRASTQPTRDDYVSGRIDHRLNEDHSFFGRYTFDDSEVTEPGVFDFDATGNTARNQYVTLQETAIVSPTFLNTFRMGFNRSFSYEQKLITGIPSSLNWVPGVPLFTSGTLSVSGGLSSAGSQRSPRGFAHNQFEWSDDASYVWKGHSFKTGVLIQRLRINSNNQNAGGGQYEFGSIAEFLQGIPSRFLVNDPNFPQERGLRQTLFGIYLQDDIRLNSKLTINAGLRWEFMTSPNEQYGRFANLEDVTDIAPRVGNPLFYTFKKNLAPRVGVAWDLAGDGKTAIRTGFGLFYDQPFPVNWTTGQSVRQPPFAKLYDITPTSTAPIPFPNGLQAVLQGVSSPTALQPIDYTGTTYSMHYNLAVERQLTSTLTLSVGHTGSQTRKLLLRQQKNVKIWTVLRDGRKFFPEDNPLINPNYGTLQFLTTDGNSNYNGLLVSVRKNYSQGLQLQGSYTFSKVMSDGDTVVGNDFALGQNQATDAYNVRLDRGPAEFDTKHNFVLNSTYDFPFSRNLQGLRGGLLGGWQLSGILRISSGSPFSPLTAFGSFNASGPSERPDLVPGRSNNPILGGPDMYYDITAFTVDKNGDRRVTSADRGLFGNLGRDTITDPGVVNLDVSFFKNTPVQRINENFALQFRAEFFNILNRANFGTPRLNLFDRRGAVAGGAGAITSTVTASRQIQFGLKAIW